MAHPNSNVAVSPLKSSGTANTKKSEDGGAKPEANDPMMKMLGEVVGIVKGLDSRLNRLETGGINDFKRNPNVRDVEEASDTKKNINPRIVQIVEETLGDDFGVD